MARRLSVYRESWPLKSPFAISRGVKTEAEVVVVEIVDGLLRGRGECVPYQRYGETVNEVIKTIKNASGEIEKERDRNFFLSKLRPGAARNAVDSALWDLDCKLLGCRAWELAGLAEPLSVLTAETIGIDTIKNMGKEAGRLKKSTLIKVKLDNENVLARMSAVRDNAPLSRLIVDPNEGWTVEQLNEHAQGLKSLGVEMIEQPLPVDKDEALNDYNRALPICADESCHSSSDLSRLLGKYQIVNIKLDKTGGLTEALRLNLESRAMGFKTMVGCMVGTSLAMAPALLLVSQASFVDLDGPLLLKHDREFGLRYDKGLMGPLDKRLWG